MHKTLNELLQNYTPSDSWEQECKKRICAFIQEHPEDCFDRSLAIGHITASIWLLDCAQTHALLMHHTKLDKWMQLGGHCDGDSDVFAVAIKEAQEESGIQEIVPVCEEIFDLDIHTFPSMGQQKEHYHYDIRFLLQVAGAKSIVQNHESKELRWISKNRDELPTQSRSIVRMFDKWRAI